MRHVRIGLIDSGPCSDSKLPVAAYRDFTGGASQDLLGHGTAIATILANSHHRVQLLVARVFEQRPVCPVERVVQALEWLKDEQVDIINMSFGLRESRKELRLACERAARDGILLVAASPARGAPVYPAALGCVIRATGDARCATGELSLLRSTLADFGGCVRHPGVTVAGASIGCASVTARFAAAMAENGNDWFRGLCQRAVHYHGPERRRIAAT